MGGISVAVESRMLKKSHLAQPPRKVSLLITPGSHFSGLYIRLIPQFYLPEEP